MSDSKKTEAFGKALREQLDDSVSPEIAARLRAAREEAVFVAEQRSKRGGLLSRPLVPVGGAVAAGTLALMLVNEPQLDTLPVMDDAEMAAAAELELLEDLELLAWLED